MVLELQSRTIIGPLSFTYPLTVLACHGVRMFVRYSGVHQWRSERGVWGGSNPPIVKKCVFFTA